MFNNFLSSLALIEVLIDVKDEEFVIMSARALCIDLWCNLIIVLFTDMVIDRLVGGMIDFNMLTEFRMFMVVAAVVVLDIFAAV